MTAAACASSFAPDAAISTYIAGVSTGASVAQPARHKAMRIAAAARINQTPRENGPLLHTNRG